MTMPDIQLQNELFRQGLIAKIDPRVIACEVHAEKTADGVHIGGFTMFRQTDKFVRNLAAKAFAGRKLTFDLKTLVQDFPIGFYEVVTSSAAFYKETRVRKDDLLTEALFGSVMRGFFVRQGFVFAQHADGYVGYVPERNLIPVDEKRYLRWKNGRCAILRSVVKIDGVVVPPASRLVCEDSRVQLPSGEWLKVPAKEMWHVHPQDKSFVNSIERHASAFQNTPYLWGGKTHEGIDCSGFVQSLLLQERILVPRDANMQAFVGEIVGYLPDFADLLPGDLVFFMNNNAHIFHVGILLPGKKVLHSAGSQNIIRSSLVRGGDNYSQRYSSSFVFARRVLARA